MTFSAWQLATKSALVGRVRDPTKPADGLAVVSDRERIPLYRLGRRPEDRWLGGMPPTELPLRSAVIG